MTDRKTNRELLDELDRAYEVSPVSVNSLHKAIVTRFRDLLDRVDIVNDRAELHPAAEKVDPHSYRDGFNLGYARACQPCKEDLSDERS